MDLTLVLALLLPLVVVLGIALTRPAESGTEAHPPVRTALARATLVCPSPLGRRDTVSLTSTASGVRGQAQVGLGRDADPVLLVSGRVTTVRPPGNEAVAVTASDAAAPGLVAVRGAAGETAAAPCRPPAPVRWFTGVGAGAGHTSVLYLTNPDPGTAVADITVYARSGVVDAPRLRGVSVPGASTVRLDLARLVPRRGELALQVVSARGRIAAQVVDRIDPVGRGPRAADWLAGQPAPATANLLLGIAPGAAARRTLVVANGGPDEVRVSLQAVSGRSVFTPEGAPSLRVPPQSTVRANVGTLVRSLLKDDVTGLLVTGSAPVTATLRTSSGADLSHAVAAPTVGLAEGEQATVLLPDREGERSAEAVLQLAGASTAGAVEVTSRTALGRKLATTRVKVEPDRGYSVDLPAAARQVTIVPAGTALAGAVLLTDRDGATVLPFTVPQLSGLVPQVRPGLP